MTWNYRIFKTEHPDGSYSYGIHEAYYDDGQDTPHSWTVNPVPVDADSAEDLREVLQRMLIACDKPCLQNQDDGDKPGRPPREGWEDAARELAGPHGSTLDSWLEEEGIKEHCDQVAGQRVSDWALTLSPVDRDRVLAAIEQPPEPEAALQKANKEHQQLASNEPDYQAAAAILRILHITNDTECSTATALLELLAKSADPAIDPIIDRLADAIETYEQKYHAIPTIPPASEPTHEGPDSSFSESE